MNEKQPCDHSGAVSKTIARKSLHWLLQDLHSFLPSRSLPDGWTVIQYIMFEFRLNLRFFVDLGEDFEQPKVTDDHGDRYPKEVYDLLFMKRFILAFSAVCLTIVLSSLIYLTYGTGKDFVILFCYWNNAIR